MDKLRKIIREEVAKQMDMDEMFKSDVPVVEKIKQELLKKYGDDPAMAKKIEEFIAFEGNDPYFTVDGMLKHLKLFLNVELG